MMCSKLREHLRSRNIQSFTNIIFGDDCVYFLLYGFDGRLNGYQRYSPYKPKIKANEEGVGKYYTYVISDDGRTKRLAVWGVDTIVPGQRLYVVEGVFDASVLHRLGLPAIAILTSTPSKSLLNQLRLLPVQLFAVGDGDHGGEMLVKKIKAGVTCPLGIDLEDMSAQQIRKVLNA